MTNEKDIETAKSLLGVISEFTEVISFKLFGSRARGDGGGIPIWMFS